MSVAATAGDRGAVHSVALVGGLDDVLFRNRGPAAGPARARLELGAGIVQGSIAADAAEDAFAMLLEERSGKSPFGPLVSSHLKRGRGQLLLPLLFRLHNPR